MEKLSLNQVMGFVKGQCSHPDVNSIEITNICTDTRKIEAGCLYVPIKGERFDGHQFIEDAFSKGAVAVLSHEKVSSDQPIVYVKDTRQALGQLAKGYLSLFDIPVIGVTGSVGKTSCKDMIAAVLGAKYNVLKTEGNFNNDIGLPLTIFNLNHGYEIAVLEMGMNHFGEIDYLSQIAEPDYGVITNVGVSHIENLGSREGIYEAKKEIFNHMGHKDLAIINMDDDYLPRLIDDISLDKKTFGIKNKADYMAHDIRSLGYEGMGAIFTTPTKEFGVIIPVLGEHMIYNALPAIAIAEELGLNRLEIIEGLQSFKPTKMRLNIHQFGNNITVLDDVYNASPDSMKAALDTLIKLPSRGKRIAILGDMFEMGDHAKDGHLEVGKFAHGLDLDLLLCVGNDARYIKEGYGTEKSVFHFPNIEELKGALPKIMETGDTILLKASRGMHFEKIIENIKEVTL